MVRKLLGLLPNISQSLYTNKPVKILVAALDSHRRVRLESYPAPDRESALEIISSMTFYISRYAISAILVRILVIIAHVIGLSPIPSIKISKMADVRSSGHIHPYRSMFVLAEKTWQEISSSSGSWSKKTLEK